MVYLFEKKFNFSWYSYLGILVVPLMFSLSSLNATTISIDTPDLSRPATPGWAYNGDDDIDDGVPGANALYGDWPVVGQGYSNLQKPVSSGINSTNAAALLGNVLWTFDSSKVPTASGVAGAPSVADGKVYFADGFPFGGGSIYAVNLTTGAPIWRNGPPTSLAPTNPSYIFLQDAAFADGPVFISTPVLTKDRLYIASANGTGAFTPGSPFIAKMHCLDRNTGKRIWSANIGPIVTNEGKTYQPNDYTSDPTVVDDLVIVGVSSAENFSQGLNTPPLQNLKARGGVIAFDKNTGAVKWKFYNTSDQSVAKPEFGAGAGSWSSPAIDLKRKLLFIGVGQSFEHPASPMTDSLLAINYRTGKLKWHIQMTKNDVWDPYTDSRGMDWDVNTHPNLFTINVPNEGAVDYVGVADKGGRYYLIRRDQNKNNPKIDAMITLDRGNTSGTNQSTPVIDDVNDFLFIVSNAIRSDSNERVAQVEAAAILGLGPFDTFLGVVDPKIVKIDLRAMLADPAHPINAIVKSSENLPGLPYDNSGEVDAPLTFVNDVIVFISGNGNVRIIKQSDLSLVAQTGPATGDFTHFPITLGGASIVGNIMLVPTINLGGVGGGVRAYKLP